jgi:hypothetical protein
MIRWQSIAEGRGRTDDDTSVCQELNDANERMGKKLAQILDERDRLAEACDQYSEDEILCKLQEITAQRDRLADLTKQFIAILDITEESDSGRLFHPTNITSCRAGDLQKIGELFEALRRASSEMEVKP